MSDVYKVSGMSCGGCARAVENAIKEEAPGAEVAVDVASGRVTVANAAEASVAKAVDAAGFEFLGRA